MDWTKRFSHRRGSLPKVAIKDNKVSEDHQFLVESWPVKIVLEKYQPIQSTMDSQTDSSGNSSLVEVEPTLPSFMLKAVEEEIQQRNQEKDIVAAQVTFVTTILKKIRNKKRQIEACQALQNLAKSFLTDADMEDN